MGRESSFGTYLDTYDRLVGGAGAKTSAVAVLLNLLVTKKKVSLGDLVSLSGLSNAEIDDGLAKLQDLEAITIKAGIGLKQEIEVTEKASSLLDLFK